MRRAMPRTETKADITKSCAGEVFGKAMNEQQSLDLTAIRMTVHFRMYQTPHTDIPSPTFSSSSATDQIAELGSRHTRGRLGGVLLLGCTR